MDQRENDKKAVDTMRKIAEMSDEELRFLYYTASHNFGKQVAGILMEMVNNTN